MTCDGIKRCNGVHLRLGFVLIAAHHPRRLQIVFFQVAPCRDIVRVQLHRFFEFLFYFSRVGKTAVAVRFAAVDSAQPLMVDGILGIERDGLLACRNRIVIIVQFVIGAAQPVVSLRAVGILRDGGLQGGDRR